MREAIPSQTPQSGKNECVSRSILVRSALTQTVLVGALSALLALALGGTFFTHWGWIVGPAAWIACSLATARLLALPVRFASTPSGTVPKAASSSAVMRKIGDSLARKWNPHCSIDGKTRT